MPSGSPVHLYFLNQQMVAFTMVPSTFVCEKCRLMSLCTGELGALTREYDVKLLSVKRTCAHGSVHITAAIS